MCIKKVGDCAIALKFFLEEVGMPVLPGLLLKKSCLQSSRLQKESNCKWNVKGEYCLSVSMDEKLRFTAVDF